MFPDKDSKKIFQGEYMSELASKKCIPCRGGVPALKGKELEEFASQVEGWNVVDEHHLTRDYKFQDFAGALAFVNRVGHLAEDEGHHPDVYLAWGKVRLDLWTHKIDGLTESDFIFAAKVNELPE